MLNRVILNRVTLNKALLNRHYKVSSNQVKKYTVDDLIQLGYLTAYGNENEGYRIDTAQPLPMPIKDIKDFDAVFIGRSVPASVDTQRACMFNLSDKSHLTESQQKEIISKYNNKPNDRAISQLLFRNYTLPNADLKIIQNKTTEDSWQYSHKMFEGSTFNNVELNIKGSISSANKLFMGLKCNELEIYTNSTSGNNVVAGTDIIAPHDTTEMFASSAINKYPRGVSFYRGLANWTFTNNWNGKATEIPNVRGVETEEERITSPINVMKLPSGILYQTLWISSITRIGPVLDVTNVTGSEYLWGNCGIQLPNVTDIRIKGLNNLDWDFRGGATDKAYIPKMDEDSIIYCLNNVVEQTGTTRNIHFSTEVIKPTYEENSAKLKAALSNASTKGWNVYCGDTALIIPDTPPVGKYIQFEDKNVEAICVANWSSDGIGLTEEDAAAVTSIGTTFKGNKEITSFDEFRYFTGVTTIGDEAFKDCTSMTSMELPSGIKKIGRAAFANCSARMVLDLPNLTDIANDSAMLGAFYNSGVTEILNLGTITQIRDGWDAVAKYGVFGGCVNLRKAILPISLYKLGYAAFRGCTSLSEINLDGVTIYRASSLRECSSLLKVEFAAETTKIEDNALNNCSSLEQITSRATTPPTLGSNAFTNTNNCPIYVPDASLEAYKTAVNWSAYADRIHPLSEIEGSPYIQFEDAEVERVLMANGVSSDGVGITMEDAANVTSIGTWFKENDVIEYFDEFQYFTGISTLSTQAFRHCDSLIRITIPASITEIPVAVFDECRNLENVIVKGQITTLAVAAFRFCKSLKSIDLQSSIQSIQSIGAEAFLQCTSYAGEMILPNCKTIGYNALKLTNIKKVVLLGIQTMRYRAFQYCQNLEYVELGDTLTSFENHLFADCNALTTLICRATTPPTAGNDIILGSDNATIYVPDASVDAYKSAWSSWASRIKGISEYNG